MHGCTKKNRKDKADVTDSPELVKQPQECSEHTDTVFIQKCFKNTAMAYDQTMDHVKPQEGLKVEPGNSVIDISDDDNDKVKLPARPIHNNSDLCPQSDPAQEEVQQRKKRKRKQRLEKTLLDGYGSPGKQGTESSACMSDGVTTVRVPVWDNWSTNMVCIKASKKRKTIPNSEERKMSSEHHLLEIRSNCNWDASRKMVLSGVAKCLRPYEYPEPQEIQIQNYTVEILPKASEPAKIPPKFSANFPSVIYTVRIMVSPTWFHRKNKKVEDPKKEKASEMTASKQLCLRLLQEQQQKAALQQQRADLPQQQQKEDLQHEQKPADAPTVQQQQQQLVLQQLDPVDKSVVEALPVERNLKKKSVRTKKTSKHIQSASGISGLGKLKINQSFIQLNPNTSQQNSVFRLQEGQVTFKSSLPPTSVPKAAGKNPTGGLELNGSNTPGGLEDSVGQNSSTVVTVSGSTAMVTSPSKPSTRHATAARASTSVTLSSQKSGTTASVPSSVQVGIRSDSLPTMQLIQNGAGMPKLVPLSAGKVSNMPLLQLVPMANTAGPRGTTPVAVRMQGQPGKTTNSLTSGNKNYVAFPVILQTVNPSSTSGGTGVKSTGASTVKASGIPTGCVTAPSQSSVFPVKMGTEQRPVFLAPVTVQPAKSGVIPATSPFTLPPLPTLNSTCTHSQKDQDKDMDNEKSAGKTDTAKDNVSGINLTGRRELYSVLTSSKPPSQNESTSCRENKTPKKKPDLDKAVSESGVDTCTGDPDVVRDSSVIDSAASSSGGLELKQSDKDQELKSPLLKTEAVQSERIEKIESLEDTLTTGDVGEKSLFEVRSLVASKSGVNQASKLSSGKQSDKPVTKEKNFVDLTEENSDDPSCALETSDMSVSKSSNDERKCVNSPTGFPSDAISKYTLEKPVLANIQKLLKKSLGFTPRSMNTDGTAHANVPKDLSPKKSSTLDSRASCSDISAEVSSSGEMDSVVSESGVYAKDTPASATPRGTGITEGVLVQTDHTVSYESQEVAKATSLGALTSELDSYSLDSWSDVSIDGDSQQESCVSAGPTHSPPLRH